VDVRILLQICMAAAFTGFCASSTVLIGSKSWESTPYTIFYWQLGHRPPSQGEAGE